MTPWHAVLPPLGTPPTPVPSRSTTTGMIPASPWATTSWRSLTRRVVTSLKRRTNSSNNSSNTQEAVTLLMRRAFDTTLPRASISRTRSGLRRLSSPTSRSHRPYAAGLALYLATSPYPQPVGSIGNPPFPSQRGLPPDIFGGARWEVYCRSIHRTPLQSPAKRRASF